MNNKILEAMRELTNYIDQIQDSNWHESVKKDQVDSAYADKIILRGNLVKELGLCGCDICFLMEVAVTHFDDHISSVKGHNIICPNPELVKQLIAEFLFEVGEESELIPVIKGSTLTFKEI